MTATMRSSMLVDRLKIPWWRMKKRELDELALGTAVAVAVIMCALLIDAAMHAFQIDALQLLETVTSN